VVFTRIEAEFSNFHFQEVNLRSRKVAERKIENLNDTAIVPVPWTKGRKITTSIGLTIKLILNLI
jgi:hypothetical protein